MLGGIIIAVILLLAPVAIFMSMSAVAALMGFFMNRDANERHEGSELLDSNY